MMYDLYKKGWLQNQIRSSNCSEIIWSPSHYSETSPWIVSFLSNVRDNCTKRYPLFTTTSTHEIMMSGQVSWFLDFIYIFYNLNTPGRHVRRDISCTRWVTFPPIACIRPQIGVTNMNIDFYLTVFQYFKYLQIKFELSQENTINEINA